MANIKGLSDFQDKDSDSENGDFNDYYAGGEKSGQLIRGAPDEEQQQQQQQQQPKWVHHPEHRQLALALSKKKADKGDKGKGAVESLFERAKELPGAERGTGDLPSTSGSFGGQGRTVAGGAAQPAGPTAHVVKFYRNNVFTLNDGPARAIDDPANQDFMDAVARGECPSEIDPGPSAEPVTVNLLRVEEDYVPPKYVAFSGSGRTLAAGPSTSAAPAPAAPAGEWEGVDESKPTTSLQLRLYDGERMVARFNHTHTLADVRRFIRASRPDMSAPYTLNTAFPPAPVKDEGATLEAAGLLNAVLIQRKA
ncbi:NSFL1 cofactor [Monoraphidium neglectum]|uniref:NSFL1 cofactor n=1 Tax=Monoraphidium neglectum TaxID=145388 RepID=A0A0D2MRF4_9CHLO|nr:NSFL1 cofactor [Monoraphidium neglectum]KIZ03042.1 NSFL1 cofactor [Monoraphidium neglectum]|eukprot:XP_013902061.1 NSFL1 cofactor [Monoraphidium neglectum]